MKQEKQTKRIVLILSACLIILPCVDHINAATPLEVCGYHNLYLVMEQVPESEMPWWQKNNDHMWLYNQYMDIYRSESSDGTWGRNDENEFGGFPSDDDLYDKWEFYWNSALGATLIRWWYDDECGEILESDIIFNPANIWTGDRDYAEDHPDDVVYYDSVLLHELGHSWGMQIRGGTETYDYDEPTVMHRYRRYSVQDHMAIHVPEAHYIRQQYYYQTLIPILQNMVVVSKHVGFTGTWWNSYPDSPTYSYYTGDPIS